MNLLRKLKRAADVRRFVSIVLEDAECTSVVIMSASGGGRFNRRYGWWQMEHQEFRDAVMAKLEGHPKLREPRFSAPDEYDGWTFYAYRARPREW